jgi:hypothetical protein
MNYEFPFCGECEVNIVPAVADEVLATGGIGAGFFFTPERGVVAVRLGQAIGVFARRYLLLVVEVERYFHERSISDSEFLVNAADFLPLFARCAKSPQSG